MNDETGAKSLGELIEGKNFRIPMYQRNYKWNKDVAIKLVEDIVACYENNQQEKSLGLITLYNNGSSNIYDVIDGQQRFTTLAILLSILDSGINIDLSFERDRAENSSRSNAVKNIVNCGESTDGKSTDVNRINRNREGMLCFFKEKLDDSDFKENLANYILDKVIMLCSIVSTLPVEEFMNLNAYKTAFSISDHIRANLIALNSFYRAKLEEKNTESILARCLSNHSYKTAVAILYNNIQEKLYMIEEEKGKYKSIFTLLKEPEIIIDPDKSNESRINILFGSEFKEGVQCYESGEITEDLDYWIKMLQKLAFINRLLDELKDEFEQKNYHSFKQIDDYQKLTKKSFIREVFDGIDNKWDSQTLAKEIQKYSNVDSVLIRCLNQDSKKLANRYLEAFVHSENNSETCKQADNEKVKKVKLPQMAMEDVIEEISGCGRYVIDRYEIEHRNDLNICIDIPPVLDLEDCENINFGEYSLDGLNGSDEISVGTLFSYDIKIPVIQRDYCMGARITGENDFLSFLLVRYRNNKENDDKNVSASTILLSVSEDSNGNKELYIFDGQQRTFTLYNILSYCLDGEESLEHKYNFVGRISENDEMNNVCGSPYSEKAVNNLKEILKKKLADNEKKGFANYIKNNVFLKVKTVKSVSGAEQFFMDINGGVALQKYEIYKAMLCDKLSKMGKSDVVRKIENEWLHFFYLYRENYLDVSDIHDKEDDEEELLEIRFIEYVIRFVYRMNHIGIKYEVIGNYSGKQDDILFGKKLDYELSDVTNFYNSNLNENSQDLEIDGNADEEILLSFDEIESKGEMVAKLKYLENINCFDIDYVETIMRGIMGEIAENNNQFNSKAELCKIFCDYIPIDSQKRKVYLAQVNMKDRNKPEVIENKFQYVNRFIWSLSDENREYIRAYYKYGTISKLKEMYDDDQIIRDIFLHYIDKDLVKGDIYVYNLPSGKNINIYGGYNNEGINIQEMAKLPVKELPVYYWSGIEKEIKKISLNGDIIRLCYLQDKSANNGSEELYYALVPSGIEYEDGTKSKFIQIKGKIEYQDIGNKYNRSFSINKGSRCYFTTKSAYIFKYDARKYVETYKL